MRRCSECSTTPRSSWAREVEQFETAFARYCEVRHAIGVASGTAALQLALLACGVGPGDEVITSSFTFIATAEAISHIGARPVLVDIDPDDFNLVPEQVEAAIGATHQGDHSGPSLRLAGRHASP